ncbi:hypothetical protein HanRHA438_Chr09g0424931 [Helianthus annuus]|nr:hypothetical protein HanRHA438_Chr09g0424931 [Helianthus annuus]
MTAAIEVAAAMILSQIWEAMKDKCVIGEGIGWSFKLAELLFSVSIAQRKKRLNILDGLQCCIVLVAGGSFIGVVSEVREMSWVRLKWE